jgi:hypothetical protein
MRGALWLSIVILVLIGDVQPDTAAAQSAAACKYGIGGQEAKPLAVLIGVAKTSLEPGEAVVGAWLDPCGPCSLIIISRHPRRGLDHFDVCADGSTSRNILAAGDDLRWSPLVAITPPKGAKRAWQTPGLVCRPKTILGKITQQCTDGSGAMNDRDTFIEQRDGTLQQFQDGVGLSGDHAVAKARPIELQ